MRYTSDYINKRVAYHVKGKPTRYGYIRDIANLTDQQMTDGTTQPRQMIDFAEDGSGRQVRYVWGQDIELLPEEHPEYVGPTD